MKLPKATKRGDAWRIQFMYDGARYSSTHDTEKQAQEWAARKILEVKDKARRAESGELPEHTYREAIQLYMQHVTVKKKGVRWETLRLNKLMRENPHLVDKQLSKLTKHDFTNYKERRLLQVKPTTVAREMELLGGVLSYCVNDLGWVHVNVMSSVKRPQEAPPRHRRASDAEIAAIVERSKYAPDAPVVSMSHQVGWCVLFALETAMRMSEITGMTWADVHLDQFFVRLPDTKSGMPRNVPLSEEAERLLRQIVGLDKKRVLTITSASLSTMFRRFMDELKIDGLRFHDLRHESITRMAQIIKNPADLQKITGHTDVNILVNVYYNPTPTEVAMRLRGGKV
jgi:integrase